VNCNKEHPNASVLLEPAVINHVADIFERESSDAWYQREAKELLPEGFKCPTCGGGDFTKETDILDVWFDSGSSWPAVFKDYFAADLHEWQPADVYLEGGDQYRGWFNSSLLISLAKYHRAPYRTVVTHGWLITTQGEKMSKSQGTGISPNEVVKESGADILRLWVASSDYHEDVRCSEEILQRTVDAYRKIRNTARFALGNLYGFDLTRDGVAEEDMEVIDRWALAELNRTIEAARGWYEKYEFHNVFHTVYDFCVVTLSARYFDIIKDTLYTAAPRNIRRRSAQTALYNIVDALARLMAPILPFTAEEIWENLPLDPQRPASVHLTAFPAPVDSSKDQDLRKEWDRLFLLRDEVLAKLEEERSKGVIGSSLRAVVAVARPRLDDKELFERYWDRLRYIFIVSGVRLADEHEWESDAPILSQFKIELAPGEKCERCWNYSTRVGESETYPTVCERCVAALEEIEQEQSS
jgi:isoleucyl-tRNA synthetase